MSNWNIIIVIKCRLAWKSKSRGTKLLYIAGQILLESDAVQTQSTDLHIAGQKTAAENISIDALHVQLIPWNNI